MEVRIVARHFDLTEELKEFAQTRVESFKKYFDKIVDVHIMLEVEKYRKTAEISLLVLGNQLVTKETTDDMYASLDQAAKKMERRLRKYEDKIKEHKGVPKEVLKEKVKQFYKHESTTKNPEE